MTLLRGLAAFTALWIGWSVSNPNSLAQEPARARPTAFTVDDVIRLVQAGLSEDIVLQQIRLKGHAFDLSSDQIIKLKAAGVSDRIVEALLDPAKTDAPFAHATSADAPPAALPAEIGVYARKQDRWVEIQPEIVYWKTAGALKTIATAGIHHGNVNGRVPGPASHTSFDTPLQFLIVAPEGVAMAEYRLLRLRRDKQDREFRIVTGGLLHSESGEFRDMLTFDGARLAEHVYEIHFPTSAGPGEYGLLPPGSTNGSGKIYSFRMVD
jgi:hypothetical protein